jgi:cytidylate kinase
MKKNEKFVITINREVGSGGRTVGRKLAERLNVKYYDKALVQRLTEKYGLTLDEIERLKAEDEEKTWWRVFSRFYRSFAGGLLTEDIDDKPKTGSFMETEREIYEGLAAQESCVVAGRSAFLIFREWPNHLNVFIQASLAHRIERIREHKHVTTQHALDVIEELDAGRETYIKKYSDKSRYDTRNYHLVLSMDDLTEDDAVNVIMAYLEGVMR